ncbi:NAD-P-binding protein [Mycena epipterygia]|nr:NAD-P-binding protein [Mycena epipterygia]
MGNALGNVHSFFSQAYLSGKPTWSIAEIPDLSGKVAIVTGGNSGLGKETVKALLEHDATVYIFTRNRKTTKEVIEQLRISTGKIAHFIPLDLADLPSIKAAAHEFLQKEKHLHILFNNAGVMMPPVEQTTRAGHDLSLGVNVLGHFYLTKLLMPALIAAVNTSGEKARVVSTSSGAHYVAMYNFDAFEDGPIRRKLSLMDLYGQSKWAQVVYATELARRYGNDGIVSTSLNPGVVDLSIGLLWRSKCTFNIPLHILLFLMVQIYPAEWGALTQLYAGTYPEGVSFNGQFLIPWARVGKAAPSTNDPENGRKLWEWLEAQVVNI